MKIIGFFSLIPFWFLFCDDLFRRLPSLDDADTLNTADDFPLKSMRFHGCQPTDPSPFESKPRNVVNRLGYRRTWFAQLRQRPRNEIARKLHRKFSKMNARKNKTNQRANETFRMSYDSVVVLHWRTSNEWIIANWPIGILKVLWKEENRTIGELWITCEMLDKIYD